jgi:hypothetical protein
MMPEAIDIYAADKARIRDTDWSALHVESDRRHGIVLSRHRGPDRVIGFGVRRERGRLFG